MDKYSYIANAHGNYIDELYQSFKQDPKAVDESWQRFFEGFEKLLKGEQFIWTRFHVFELFYCRLGSML